MHGVQRARTRMRQGVAALATVGLALTLLVAVPAQAATEGAASGVDLDARIDGTEASQRRPGDRKRARRAAPAPAASEPGADGRAAASSTPSSRGVRLSAPNIVNTGDARLQLARVDVTQNIAAGQLSATAVMRATPTVPAAVRVYLGRWSGNDCMDDAAIVISTTTAVAGGFVGATEFGATRRASGATLSATSTGAQAAIRAADWNCAFALVSDPGGPPIHHSLFAETLVDQYPPALQIDAGAPVQGNYRGKWTKLRLEIYNASRSDATNVVLRAKGKGLQVKPKSINLGTLSRRSTKYGVEVRVRLKGKKARRLALTATTGGRSFGQRVTIAQRPRPKPYKSLAGRYFWGYLPASSDTGWDNRAIWFLDRRWAHTDFAENGKKPKCRKAKGACQRYTYNSRTGQARIGGRKVKITTEGFRFKVNKNDRAPAYMNPTTLAKRNQKFQVALKRNDFRGMCGIFCTTWTEWISMERNGRFVLSRQTIGSLGPPGVGSIWAGMPPDNRGTYRVLRNGQVELRFASGKKQRHTLAVEHDVRGRPSPSGVGLVLGERNFYRG